MATIWNPGNKKPNAPDSASNDFMGAPALTYEGILPAINDTCRLNSLTILTDLATTYPSMVDASGDTLLTPVMIRIEAIQGEGCASFSPGALVPSTNVVQPNGPPALTTFNADIKKINSKTGEAACYETPNDPLGVPTWKSCSLIAEATNTDFAISVWVRAKGQI